MLRIEKKIHYEKKISEEHFTYGNMQMVSKHEKSEQSGTTCGNVKWCSLGGKEKGSLKN